MSTLEQEQLDACQSPTSMTSKCLISPAEQEERWHHHQHRNHTCSHCGCPSTKKVNNNNGDTDIKRTDDNYTITSRWTSTSAKSNGRHTYVIDSTSTGQLTDGHSTNKPSQQTSNAITAKETPGGWHSRRKLHRATANSSTARSTSTTGAKTGTTKEQTEDHQAYTQTKQGEEITAYSCEDVTEQQTERILLEPIVNNTDGFDKQNTLEGMKQEILSMKQQQVYMEVDINTLTPEQRKNIIQSRWVLRDKGNKVRSRIVAKGFTETVTDLDDIYASTPISVCWEHSSH